LNCTLSRFRYRQPKAQFAKKIIVQDEESPTPVPTPAPVQTKEASTGVPTPEGPIVNLASSAGICGYKLSMLLQAVVASFFFFTF
jgi:hypothetical protein